MKHLYTQGHRNKETKPQHWRTRKQHTTGGVTLNLLLSLRRATRGASGTSGALQERRRLGQEGDGRADDDHRVLAGGGKPMRVIKLKRNERTAPFL